MFLSLRSTLKCEIKVAKVRCSRYNENKENSYSMNIGTFHSHTARMIINYTVYQ